MDFNITSFLVGIVLALVVNEAISGQQKKFARVAVGVLLINMIMFNIGFYEQSVADPIAYFGLGIVALMFLIRMHYLATTASKNN